MKLSCVLLFSFAVLFGGQSVHLPHGKHGTVSNPPFLNSDEFRIEFRMKNRTLATGAYVTGLSIPGIAEFRLQRADTGNDVICYHVPTNLFRRITVSTSMDFEIRMQYKVTTPGVAGVLTCEGWDIGVAGTPALITATQSINIVPDGEAGATTITLGPACTTACGSQANSSFDMAYLRIFLNSEVPDNSLPPAASLVKGNLYNYEFDGTTTTELGAGTNTSGAPRNLTWDGDVTDCPSVGGTAPCVLPTPANAPVCDIGSTQVFRAGETLTATAAASYSRNEVPLSSYAWSMDEYPAGSVPQIVDNNSRSVSIGLRNTVFGQYILRATVADAGGESSCTVTHGVSVFVSQGIVVYPPDTPAAVKVLIGPMIAAGTTQTTWLDTAAFNSADLFDSKWGIKGDRYDRRNFWDGGDTEGNWAPGTVTIRQADTTTGTAVGQDPSFTVTCTTPGTCNFRSTVCNASGNPIVGTGIFVNYPAWENGGGSAVQGGYASAVPISTGETGWLTAFVQGYLTGTGITCPDNDTLILALPSNGRPIDVGAPKGTVMSGRAWSYFTGLTLTPFQAWSAAQPSAVDFYDSGLAFYSMYYRTGLKKYQTRARYFADRHYSNAVSLNKGFLYRDGKYCGTTATDATTCFYRSEGSSQRPMDTNLFSTIIRALDGKPEYWTGLRRVCNAMITWADDGAGDREHGYGLAFLSACALADPDNTKRAEWVKHVNASLDAFLATRCGGSAGKVCHGRNFGQWIIDTWTVCPANPAGVTSRQTCVGGPGYYTKLNWKAKLTNGSDTVEMVNGDLTFPSAHPNYPSQPIAFGQDDKRVGNRCEATGSMPTFTCSLTPPATTYTGLMISLVAPVNIGAAATINVDGLGTKSIVNVAGSPYSTLQPITANVPMPLRYDSVDGRFEQVAILPQFYPRLTTDLGYAAGQDIGRAFYWPEYVDPTHFRLKQFSLSTNRASVPYEVWNNCPAGNNPCDVDFQMDISINVGSRTQPFMMGIIMRGLDMAYQATVMDGTPNPIALTLLSDAAQWIINYAYDPDTGGLYFTRTSPGCEAQSNYGEQLQYIAAIPGTCLSDEGGSIALVPEIIGGMAAAYLRETNATRKQAIKDTTIRYMGHLYGKTGFPCYGAYEAHCDGRYITILEETYTPIATNYEVDKYLGFSYGFGGSFAWQSAEQHTEWPRAPVSRTPSISVRFANFAGTTNVLVELKDQFGQNLTPLTCSASPCQITTADSTAGNHQYRLIYRNASNATLSTGQWQALRQSP